MEKARVLIVDDSVVVRRMLTDILSAEPDIEVIGSAATASLALAKLEHAQPDVITLDVEMPDVSGLDLLMEIRKQSPHLPVIMFSALTQRAAATTLEALARGATDYVTKPSGTGSREATIAEIRRELVPRIRTLGLRGIHRQSSSLRPVAFKPSEVPATFPDVEILAVGCSTGGPNALADLFPRIPATFPVPVVIVQHMPPLFTRLLAERLTKCCPLLFREARDGDVLSAGGAWIAPGDHHLRVVRSGDKLVARVDQGPPENSCRPAVDVLFRSVAEVTGARTLAAVLTGMGQDGLRGAEAIRSRGGQIIVQDEATSVVWGMPGFIAKASLAHAVLPLSAMAAGILTRLSSASAAPASSRVTE